MSFKSEVMKIIEKRENRYAEKIDTAKDCSEKELLEEMNFFWEEILDSKEFTSRNDPIQPRDDFGFVYTLMNEYSAFRAYASLARVYQLREKTSINQKKKNVKKTSVGF